MQINRDSHTQCGTGFVFLLLIFIVFSIYSNTFQCAWHFDDTPNILQNYPMHLTDVSPDSIFRTFFAHPTNGSKIYRPLATMSFGLNWYFGKDRVTGYHIVNTAIHLLTAFILYLTTIGLFQAPNIKATYPRDSKYFIALLAAVLWAVNPVQTQTVVYIVQRMALMAAMFYILSIYFFVRARLSLSSLTRILLLLGCSISFACAIGSKENAATLPLALLLTEVVFFQDFKAPETRKRFIRIALIGIVSLIVIGGSLLLTGELDFLFKGYAVRPFTLAQRLMTEPRILIFYLSQIFFPLPGRLSFLHDIGLSTSFLKPWTTIPAVLAVFLLIGFGFAQVKKRPFLAFSIIFFFLNHLIESTIIPLELVFEHRNYLPSLFLFVPLAAGLKWLLDHTHRKNPALHTGLIVLVSILLIALGSGTFIRNKVWATETSLWLDVMKKAPGYARPYQNLAAQFKKIGRFDESLRLYRKALTLKDPKPKQSQSLSLNNIGNIYAARGEHETAISHYQKALGVDPGNEKAWYNLAVVLINTKQWEAASNNADILVSKWHHYPKYLNLKGFILLKWEKPQEAIQYLMEALELAPYDRGTLLNMGVALSLSANYEEAGRILKRADSIYPDDILILLFLAQNSLKAGDITRGGAILDYLVDTFGPKILEDFLKKQSEDNLSIPLSYELLLPLIVDKVKKKGGEFSANILILTDS
jgi:tetratricopeptide (TPR) repeat protein